MIIKDIKNKEEITIEDKTYVRINSKAGCKNCAFDDIWIGCNNGNCKDNNEYQIYILKPESDGTET